MSGSNFNDTDRIASITATKIKQIVTMADFPTPSAGVITLDADTMYEIMENLSTSDRFVLPTNSSTVLMGAIPGITSLTYTGTATFFTSADVGLFVTRQLLVIATSTGTPYDMTGLTNVQPIVAIQDGALIGWTTSLGTFDSLTPLIDTVNFVDCGAFVWTDVVDFTFIESVMVNPSGDLSTNFITIDGTAVVTGKFNGCTFTMNANEDALDIDSGIAAGSLIRIHNNSFLGAGKALDAASLDTEEIRVISDANQGLRRSRIIGSMIAQGNDVATVIDTQGVGDSNYKDLDLGQATGSITVFASNGTGGTTVTSTAHGEPNEKLVEITGTTSYNGRHEIFAQTANTYDIDVTFVADDATGTWTSGAFADVDIERWTMTNATTGELTYIGIEDFSGEIIATISATAVGGANKRYKFRAIVNGVDGFAQPNDIRTATTETTFRKGINVTTGQVVKMQVANFSDTSNIIIDTISIEIR